MALPLAQAIGHGSVEGGDAVVLRINRSVSDKTVSWALGLRQQGQDSKDLHTFSGAASRQTYSQYDVCLYVPPRGADGDGKGWMGWAALHPSLNGLVASGVLAELSRVQVTAARHVVLGTTGARAVVILGVTQPAGVPRAVSAALQPRLLANCAALADSELQPREARRRGPLLGSRRLGVGLECDDDLASVPTFRFHGAFVSRGQGLGLVRHGWGTTGQEAGAVSADLDAADASGEAVLTEAVGVRLHDSEWGQLASAVRSAMAAVHIIAAAKGRSGRLRAAAAGAAAEDAPAAADADGDSAAASASAAAAPATQPAATDPDAARPEPVTAPVAPATSLDEVSLGAAAREGEAPAQPIAVVPSEGAQAAVQLHDAAGTSLAELSTAASHQLRSAVTAMVALASTACLRGSPPQMERRGAWGLVMTYTGRPFHFGLPAAWEAAARATEQQNQQSSGGSAAPGEEEADAEAEADETAAVADAPATRRRTRAAKRARQLEASEQSRRTEEDELDQDPAASTPAPAPAPATAPTAGDSAQLKDAEAGDEDSASVPSTEPEAWEEEVEPIATVLQRAMAVTRRASGTAAPLFVGRLLRVQRTSTFAKPAVDGGWPVVLSFDIADASGAVRVSCWNAAAAGAWAVLKDAPLGTLVAVRGQRIKNASDRRLHAHAKLAVLGMVEGSLEASTGSAMPEVAVNRWPAPGTDSCDALGGGMRACPVMRVRECKHVTGDGRASLMRSAPISMFQREAAAAVLAMLCGKVAEAVATASASMPQSSSDAIAATACRMVVAELTAEPVRVQDEGSRVAGIPYSGPAWPEEAAAAFLRAATAAGAVGDDGLKGSLIRKRLPRVRLGVVPVRGLGRARNGDVVSVAGIVTHVGHVVNSCSGDARLLGDAEALPLGALGFADLPWDRPAELSAAATDGDSDRQAASSSSSAGEDDASAAAGDAAPAPSKRGRRGRSSSTSKGKRRGRGRPKRGAGAAAEAEPAPPAATEAEVRDGSAELARIRPDAVLRTVPPVGRAAAAKVLASVADGRFAMMGPMAGLASRASVAATATGSAFKTDDSASSSSASAAADTAAATANSAAATEMLPIAPSDGRLVQSRWVRIRDNSGAEAAVRVDAGGRDAALTSIRPGQAVLLTNLRVCRPPATDEADEADAAHIRAASLVAAAAAGGVASQVGSGGDGGAGAGSADLDDQAGAIDSMDRFRVPDEQCFTLFGTSATDVVLEQRLRRPVAPRRPHPAAAGWEGLPPKGLIVGSDGLDGMEGALAGGDADGLGAFVGRLLSGTASRPATVAEAAAAMTVFRCRQEGILPPSESYPLGAVEPAFEAWRAHWGAGVAREDWGAVAREAVHADGIRGLCKALEAATDADEEEAQQLSDVGLVTFPGDAGAGDSAAEDVAPTQAPPTADDDADEADADADAGSGSSETGKARGRPRTRRSTRATGAKAAGQPRAGKGRGGRKPRASARQQEAEPEREAPVAVELPTWGLPGLPAPKLSGPVVDACPSALVADGERLRYASGADQGSTLMAAVALARRWVRDAVIHQLEGDVSRFALARQAQQAEEELAAQRARAALSPPDGIVEEEDEDEDVEPQQLAPVSSTSSSSSVVPATQQTTGSAAPPTQAPADATAEAAAAAIQRAAVRRLRELASMAAFAEYAAVARRLHGVASSAAPAARRHPRLQGWAQLSGCTPPEDARDVAGAPLLLQPVSAVPRFSVRGARRLALSLRPGQSVRFVLAARPVELVRSMAVTSALRRAVQSAIAASFGSTPVPRLQDIPEGGVLPQLIAAEQAEAQAGEGAGAAADAAAPPAKRPRAEAGQADASTGDEDAAESEPVVARPRTRSRSKRRGLAPKAVNAEPAAAKPSKRRHRSGSAAADAASGPSPPASSSSSSSSAAATRSSTRSSAQSSVPEEALPFLGAVASLMDRWLPWSATREALLSTGLWTPAVSGPASQLGICEVFRPGTVGDEFEAVAAAWASAVTGGEISSLEALRQDLKSRLSGPVKAAVERAGLTGKRLPRLGAGLRELRVMKVLVAIVVWAVGAVSWEEGLKGAFRLPDVLGVRSGKRVASKKAFQRALKEAQTATADILDGTAPAAETAVAAAPAVQADAAPAAKAPSRRRGRGRPRKGSKAAPAPTPATASSAAGAEEAKAAAPQPSIAEAAERELRSLADVDSSMLAGDCGEAVAPDGAGPDDSPLYRDQSWSLLVGDYEDPDTERFAIAAARSAVLHTTKLGRGGKKALAAFAEAEDELAMRAAGGQFVELLVPRDEDWATFGSSVSASESAGRRHTRVLPRVVAALAALARPGGGGFRTARQWQRALAEPSRRMLFCVHMQAVSALRPALCTLECVYEEFAGGSPPL
ncbi:hypothetical protein FNF28_01404 [Cafeteria roenbergensis]|uniref:Uncharacterized protein n=1 Tax=Cafeteria roenbergensis TaxID=33653 RepID=A0A5A8DZ08_CAFRO|nr:hypothetical protein FNF28_01404 [Cafeteria roenbergensis]